MGRKRKSHPKKKPKTAPAVEPTEIVDAPHSFVIHRGFACPYIQDLTKDFRHVMEPFTAINLRERKTNKIKDFVNLSGVFHVSHLCIFNRATTQLTFKLARLPRGPTLTFKVHQFTLARDVLNSSRKQFVDEDIFKHSPLVIMNNFTGEGKHLKLMATSFQNMFPTINLPTVNLSTVRRCVLFSYNPVTKLVDMRHYSIAVIPVGLSRGVKKMVLGKIPNLSRCDDIADFLAESQGASDSEFEEDEANHVILAQDLRRKGNLENNKSAVKLYEIGPRITFELIKIEEALLTGEVLYHETIVKSEEEIENIRRMREKKEKLKMQRKKIQNENKQKKEMNKGKGLQNKDAKKKQVEMPPEPEVEPDDDADYYRQEVGEEPDEELFKQSDTNSRKRVRVPKHISAKRRKLFKSKDGSEKSSKTVQKDATQEFDRRIKRKGTTKPTKLSGRKSVKSVAGRMKLKKKY